MHHESNPIERPALYVVATPIGNLGDLTARSRDVLAGVDCIAAEDTRVTGQLLKHIGSHAKLISLREHNEREAAQAVIARLSEGQAVAQVSDAGTPAVSDPGARLVAQVHAAGFKVIPIPGASAVLSALAAAGMHSPRFYFHGFPEPKTTARCKEFAALANLPHSVVFFEAPHRIEACLNDMVQVFGASRVAVVARELTKTFETIRRAPLGELASWVAGDANQRRGELVVVVECAPLQDAQAGDASFDRILLPLLAALPLKQAVQLAAEISGGNRNALYQRALQLRDDGEEDDGEE